MSKLNSSLCIETREKKTNLRLILTMVGVQNNQTVQGGKNDLGCTLFANLSNILAKTQLLK